MKLRKLNIQNFRGIKNLELELDDLVVLIGENNVGKTAILQALRLCLYKLGARRRVVFGTFDFHLVDERAKPRSAEPISIVLNFAEDNVGDWDDVLVRRLQRQKILQVADDGRSQVILRVTCSYSARDLEQTWDFLDSQRAPLTGISGGALSALKEVVAFYMLDALRDAGRNFDAKGPFWRPFLNDSQLQPEKKGAMEAKLKEVNELIVDSHRSFNQVCKRLKKVQDVVPMQAGDVVSIEAVSSRMFDVLSRAQVHLGTTTGAKVPVDRHGEGTQSLAVLMLFAAFLELEETGSAKRAPLVALEEPEAHLHPSAVRTLWKTIEGISGQKLISTHSGDLLSQVPVSSVRRLARRGGDVEVFRLKPETLNDKEQRMFDYHIRRARGELLFARCWLLVEGETEVILIREIARYLDIDLEKSGVRCVPYRQGASIELFLKVAKDFGIRCCVLTDNDSQGKADQRHFKNNTEPSLLSDALHVMEQNDIEQYLCHEGFGPVYQAIYDTSPQLHSQSETKPPCPACGKGPKPKNKVTAPPDTPTYWAQLLKAIKKVMNKPDAALEVIQEIQSGKAVPPLIKQAIESSVKLAGDA